MGKGMKFLATLGTAMLASLNTFATPPCDDHTGGEGCIPASNNSSAVFEFSADFDVQTDTESGNLKFVDAANGIDLETSSIIDYSYIDLNVRGMIFKFDGNANYDEARVFATDYGSSGDELIVQLLQNGNLIYQAGGALQDECGGGVDVVSLCNEAPGCAFNVTATYQVVAKGQVRLNYTIKNTGSAAVENLNVTDSFGVLDLSSVALPLAPGATITVTAVHAITNSTVVTVSVSGNDENCKSYAQLNVPKSECNKAGNPQCDWKPSQGKICQSSHLWFNCWKHKPSTKACTPEAKQYAKQCRDTRDSSSSHNSASRYNWSSRSGWNSSRR
jgi:hypothetical protein